MATSSGASGSLTRMQGLDEPQSAFLERATPLKPKAFSARRAPPDYDRTPGTRTPGGSSNASFADSASEASWSVFSHREHTDFEHKARREGIVFGSVDGKYWRSLEDKDVKKDRSLPKEPSMLQACDSPSRASARSSLLSSPSRSNVSMPSDSPRRRSGPVTPASPGVQSANKTPADAERGGYGGPMTRTPLPPSPARGREPCRRASAFSGGGGFSDVGSLCTASGLRQLVA